MEETWTRVRASLSHGHKSVPPTFLTRVPRKARFGATGSSLVAAMRARRKAKKTAVMMEERAIIVILVKLDTRIRRFAHLLRLLIGECRAIYALFLFSSLSYYQR